MNPVDVIILAGGLGTRLQQTVPDVPKPLAPINEKPFLDILLAFLNRWDFVERVVIAVGHMSDKVIQRYKDTDLYNFEVYFSIEEKLLGTGGAIKKALQHTATDNILCLNGDSFIDVDLYSVVEYHAKHSATMTIVVREVENTDRYGAVNLDGHNRIKKFTEKNEGGSGGYINAGMYLFKRDLFDDVQGEPISLEKELLPVFLKKGVYGYIASGKFIDIGIPETYKMAQDYLTDM
ncbi:MAG: nucleotidyltransferase family protein [Thermodesulfobacteriota bacterium]